MGNSPVKTHTSENQTDQNRNYNNMKFKFSCSSCFSSASNTLAVNRSTQVCAGDQLGGEKFRVFSYNELQAASQGFHPSNKIGEGGFGSVYKGRLCDGMWVAIKVLAIDELESMRGEREFVSELSALANIKHENLVELKGCCVNGGERFLVYDYMENNSLAHTFLGGDQNRVKFGWARRRDVLLGVARGLTYLHEEAEPRIIHRDIKASNILLDHDFSPKVADFGLSKLFRDNTSHISTRVAGTMGYLAPEYAVSGHLTRKSDVYSFGVLLIEIVSGLKIVDFDVELGEQYLIYKVIGAKQGSYASQEEVYKEVLKQREERRGKKRRRAVEKVQEYRYLFSLVPVLI